MAYSRQIDLQSLYNNGDLTISLTNPATSYTATNTANSVDCLVDGLFDLADPRVALTNTVAGAEGAPKESVVFYFNNIIKAKKIKIRTNISSTLTWNVHINYGVTNQQTKEISLATNTSPSDQDFYFDLDPINGGVSNIWIELETGTSSQPHSIFEIRLFIEEESERPHFEFNDSVLTTKGWNSSRYDGRQLQGAVINKFRPGDTTYGKTPVLQNYTRNIYIGNEVIGMATTGSGGEVDNPNLVQFPNFSYLQSKFYITINDDNTITRNELEIQDENDTQKRGFYQAFYDDFPVGSSCNIILGDPKIQNNLKSSYKIYFSGGQLQKLIELDPKGGVEPVIATTRSLDNGIYILTGSETIYNNNLSDPPQHALYIPSRIPYGGGSASLEEFGSQIATSNFSGITYNESIYTAWYTGSLTTKPTGTQAQFEFSPSLKYNELGNFLDGFINYKRNSSYKGDKRLFVTLTYQNDIPASGTHNGQEQPIYTFQSQSGHPVTGGVLTNTLADLSTVEIVSSATEGPFAIKMVGTQPETAYQYKLTLASYNQWHFNYRNYGGQHTLDGPGGFPDQGEIRYNPYHYTSSIVGTSLNTAEPEGWSKGNLIISKVEDDTPSLLVPLVKSSELPSGKGDKNFVIVPENLHPYIKDNLIYFLTRAGIDIGGNTSPLIELNESRRELK